jgi:iron complex transport system substrate-binding protein
MGREGKDRSRIEWLGPAPRVPARRIVSLVPSLTDATFQLGAGAALVGRTQWCVRPQGRVESIETLGGTKDPDTRRIIEIAPDVILAGKEENTRESILQLAAAHPVWLVDPHGPKDVPALWIDLGRIVGRQEEGRRFARRVEQAIGAAEAYAATRAATRPRFLCYIWKEPWMAVGHGTYISNLLETVGLRNALPAEKKRYPMLEDAEILSADVDIHLFTTEPYRFELPRDLGPLSGKETEATLVDGQLLSWYPSLTEDGLLYARRLREKLERAEP